MFRDKGGVVKPGVRLVSPLGRRAQEWYLKTTLTYVYILIIISVLIYIKEIMMTPSIPPPAGYPAFLNDLKARIRTAQVKAALAVNRELIALYWHIGRSIVERQRTAGWGKAVVERLATDLQIAFPGLEGFSARNIWHARAFYLGYSDGSTELKQPVSELGSPKTHPLSRKTSTSIPPQPVSEIPWGHNIVLLQKIQSV